jgi:hypothetical protein
MPFRRAVASQWIDRIAGSFLMLFGVAEFGRSL